MSDLRLEYKDHDGKDRTATVEVDKFTLGRHSSCDLVLTTPGISREHARIERFGTVYVIQDLGSKFGTKVNGVLLTEPTGLKNGDVIGLGDSLEIKAELPTAAPKEEPKPAEPVAASAAAAGSSPSGGSNLVWLAVLAPLTAVFLLAFVGGGLYLWSTSGQASSEVSHDTDDPFADDIGDDSPSSSNDDDISGPSSSSSPTTRPTSSNPGTTSTPGSGPATMPTGTTVTPPDSELGKVERNAALFMRKAAKNDPRAFITAEHAQRVSAKIREVAGSPALAANLDSARKNSSGIASLANANGLKPHFLAAAAVNKLGNTRGDVLQSAQSLVDVLTKLNAQIGSERGDDAVLLIAAYDQGVAGEFLKMRNMLQKLATEFPESSREIRSIWFLEEKQRITKAEFDRALRFLAVGTVMQNPKDFGVSSEPLGD